MTEDVFWLSWSGGGCYQYLRGESRLALGILQCVNWSHERLTWFRKSLAPKMGSGLCRGIHATHSRGAMEPLWQRGPQQDFPTGVLIFIGSRLSDRWETHQRKAGSGRVFGSY